MGFGGVGVDVGIGVGLGGGGVFGGIHCDISFGGITQGRCCIISESRGIRFDSFYQGIRGFTRGGSRDGCCIVRFDESHGIRFDGLCHGIGGFTRGGSRGGSRQAASCCRAATGRIR